MQDVYIVAAQRTAVGKARGCFSTTRPDDLLAVAIKAALAKVPQLSPRDITDVIVGCAMPEAQQGMNVARIAALLAGVPDTVSAMTLNRFCASGLQAIATAADRIRLGEADVMLAGGVESMSMVPMGGHLYAPNPAIFSQSEHVGIAYGMGITAEKVAKKWKIDRQRQDSFALSSHQKALAAQKEGFVAEEIAPVTVSLSLPKSSGTQVKTIERVIEQDEGPRADSSIEALSRLRPVFDVMGSVTAGNTSQMSDGAACLVLMSEAMVSRLDVTPLAKWRGFATAGVAPEVMGIGPVEAIPKVLKQTGLSQSDIDWIELNEAFAAQSLAVIDTLSLDESKVNPRGGAIALGHPLGATGAIKATSLLHGLRQTKKRYGMVTMCIGTGMGAAGIFEAV
ncbi:MAG: acetyl-CoA C-acyltransferase [Legionellales bacterium]|nr:acetyl-CoA C-acyltransferase [Legionellales bacterium]